MRERVHVVATRTDGEQSFPLNLLEWNFAAHRGVGERRNFRRNVAAAALSEPINSLDARDGRIDVEHDGGVRGLHHVGDNTFPGANIRRGSSVSLSASITSS